MELQITDLSRGGAGVGRGADGRVVFVPFTAPGDRVSAEILDSQKRYAQGQLRQILSPGSERIEPRCAVFAKCGGCEWQHLSYPTQWKTKVSGIRHALARGGVQAEVAIEEMPAEQVWEYRNRVQLRGDRGQVGFYARGTHEIVPIERCEIARPEINAALAAVRRKGAALARPYKVEIEVSEDGTLSESWNAKHAAGGFRQVHDAQNRVLRNWVSRMVTSGNALLDLFGGAGNLSLPLASKMAEIHCVDVSVPEHQPLGKIPPGFHFHRSAVLPWIIKNRERMAAGRRWSAIIDPPREGLGRDVEEIAPVLRHWGVEEIVLVGCDPDSWVRDLGRFARLGWRIDRLGAIDLFPQTHHVESLARLRR